ncbi:MAG TPA: glycosyltransferase [Candidatus Sumerlaeota bacterium]|nr:glycosyltransferase [Candidatus Sumerlaeota bacterium]
MKIIHVIPSLDQGGAETFVIDLAEAQIRLGHEAHILCVMTPPERGVLFQKAAAARIPCHFCFSKHEPRLRTTWNLRAFFRREQPDAVQCHLARTNACGILAARLAGVRCVIATFHDTMIWNNKRQNRWGRWTLPLADGILCDSKVIRDRLADLAPRVSGHLHVAYPGIRTASRLISEEEKSRVRADLEIPQSHRIAGIIGRLAKIKDHRTFISAAEIVGRHHPDMTFLIIGDGPEKESLQKTIRERHLEPLVRLTGFVSDLEPIRAILDLFILTSLSEGFPISIMEALSAGIPVVATNTGGIPEMVEHEQNGLLCPPGRPDLIAQNIISLVRDPVRRSVMGDIARKSARVFNIEESARRILDLYSNVSRSS